MNKENHFKITQIFKRSEATVILAVLIMGIVFSVFSDSFLTKYNFFNISRTAALYIFIALAQAVVIIVGGMNISLGFIGGMTVMVTGYFMEVQGVGTYPAILIGLLVGCCAGFVNGVIITKLKLNAFVVTLATSFIFQGIVNGISQGYPYTKIPEGFDYAGTKAIFQIPVLLWMSVIALIIMSYFYRFTVTGRRFLATGGNIEAAKLSAINTDKIIILANMLSGFFASIAGLLWISRTGSAQPTTGGDWMIISFAVSVIGGTLLKGGVFNAIGLFFASYMLVMVKNGLVMLKANVYYEQSYLGIILLIAVSLESIRAIYDLYNLKKNLKSKTL